jgi:hypothetical protein
VTKAEKLSLNSLVTPARVVPSHLLDQRGHRRVDRRTPEPAWIRPVAGDQPPMPAKDRGRSDEPMHRQRPGQQSDQGGKHNSVRPIQSRLRVLPAQDRILMAQDEDLHLLGRITLSEQDQPTGDAAEHEVQQT